MTDLDPQEREAMEAAMRSGSEHGTLGESTWRAAREYSKQREEELRERVDAAFDALSKLAPAMNALGTALHNGDPLPDLRVRFTYLVPEIETAVAALAENGDDDA